MRIIAERDCRVVNFHAIEPSGVLSLVERAEKSLAMEFVENSLVGCLLSNRIGDWCTVKHGRYPMGCARVIPPTSATHLQEYAPAG